jgi:tetratricopeptide (TPR) repeat protein
MPEKTTRQMFELAVEHHRAGRVREAEEIYRQILREEPEHIDALHNLGVIAGRDGRNELSLKMMSRVIALRPNLPEAHNSLGNAIKNMGRLDDAIAAYQRAIELRDGYPEAWANLGSARKSKGDIEGAIAAYRKAVGLRPDFADAFFNLGNALKEIGRVDEAIAAFQKALRLKPGNAEALNNLGNALTDREQLDEAIEAFGQAIAIKPDFAEFYNNLGNALRAKGETDRAVSAYEKAITLRPELADGHYNLGGAMKDRAEMDAAIAKYRKAIELEPAYVRAHYNLALALLTVGNFREGWEQYEWRWKLSEFPFRGRDFGRPLWNGENIEGKTILLHAEQGLGDAIQFVRYLPMVAERGAKIILQCHAELHRVFRGIAGGIPMVAFGEDPGEFDLQCPLLSLPRAFGTEVGTIPGSVPYLSAEAELVEQWRRRLGENDGKLKVGLVWAGNPKYRTDRTRSLRLADLAPLAAIERIKFYSLQKGLAAEQTKNPPSAMELIDLGPDLKDFADTAAAISALDLVISADTSVPHLAGALGKPVWTMLQFVPDFRWMLGRADSPWYPTMRLFRQQRSGDWGGVVARVAEALGEYARGRERRSR